MKQSRFKLYKICASLGEKIFYVLNVNCSNFPKSMTEVKDIGHCLQWFGILLIVKFYIEASDERKSHWCVGLSLDN